VFENQTEKQFVFTIVDQPDRQAGAGGLSGNKGSPRRFQTRRRGKHSETATRPKPAYKWITASHQNTKELRTPPEFAGPKPLPRLIMVCAWCKGTQNAEGFWRHAEKAPQTDAGPPVSHGICPECAEKSYNEYRLATFAAGSHLASSPRVA
jgi:hypothetical protein